MGDNNKDNTPVAQFASQPNYPVQQAYPAQGYPPPQAYPVQGYPQQQPQAYPVQGYPQQAQYGGAPTTMSVSRGDAGFYDRFPRRIVCQFCNAEVMTGHHIQVSTGTNLVALAMCCFLPPYCFVPYCIDDCKDVVHTCPNCHQVVGTKRFL